jgi:hypothetical protein
METRCTDEARVARCRPDRERDVCAGERLARSARSSVSGTHLCGRRSKQRSAARSRLGCDAADRDRRARWGLGVGARRGVAMSVVASGMSLSTRVWLAAGTTDIRKGLTGLSALVQNALASNPLCGKVFVFRGRRGDLLKLLWWDGSGL